jgi:methylase of polypeptide subunit release factors
MTLHGQLSLAPLKKEPLNVLDLGTGTGIWATDYGTSLPPTHLSGSLRG